MPSEIKHSGNNLYEFASYTNLTTGEYLSISSGNALLNNVTSDLHLRANYDLLSDISQTRRIEDLYLSAGTKLEFTINGTSYNQNLDVYTVGNADTGITITGSSSDYYYNNDEFIQDGEDVNGDTVDFNASFSGLLVQNKSIKVCIEIYSSDYVDIQFNLEKSNEYLVDLVDEWEQQIWYGTCYSGSSVSRMPSEIKHSGNNLYEFASYTNLTTGEYLSISSGNALLNNVTSNLHLRANYESISDISQTTRIEDLYCSAGTRIEFTIYGTSYDEELYIYTVSDLDTEIQVNYEGAKSYYINNEIMQDGEDVNGETVDFNASLNAVLCSNEYFIITIIVNGSGYLDIQFNLTRY